MAYKSKYYDPVKAHEYYEKHKKLKGRRKKSKADEDRKQRRKARKKRLSTDGLNEAGLEASEYVKSQLDVEQKEFLSNMNKQMKDKINELKKSMTGLSEREKAVAIQKLKDDYKEMKAQAKEYFEEKYAQEMDGIRSDKTYTDGAVTKAKTKSNGKTRRRTNRKATRKTRA